MKETSYDYEYIKNEYKEYLCDLDIKQKNYIKHRLIDQIIWYDENASKKQKKYKCLMIISIISTAIIPVLSLFTTYKYGIIPTLIIAILSGMSSVLLSILNLCEYQKLWTQYRSTCEILKSILHRYLTGMSEFANIDKKERFDLLVSSCEEYMIKEYETWTKLSHIPLKETHN